MVSGRAYVNANPSYLIWMKSSSTIFVERDVAVLVDMTSMRTSGLRIVSGWLLITHSQTRWKLILDFFGHRIFVFQLMCDIFPVFLALFLDLLGHRWVGSTSVPLSCKITPDASAVSESGEEGGKNPKCVEQVCNWFSKTLLNRSTGKSVAI